MATRKRKRGKERRRGKALVEIKQLEPSEAAALLANWLTDETIEVGFSEGLDEILEAGDHEDDSKTT